jgi:fructose-bisphosphate aldolase class II
MSQEEKLLALRPDSIKQKLGSDSKICLLNSNDIFRAIKDENLIVMACNTRIAHVIPGIMRAAQDLDAAVAFELAKSEVGLGSGYTGMEPKDYFEAIIQSAEEVKFTKPFFIHGDHITVKTTESKDIESARELIKAELDAGFTSYAIDASFNIIPDNINITSDLGKQIMDQGWGLEVEVGEIGSTGTEAKLSTIEEALEMVEGVRAKGITPNLLAINNGSKHGNYKPGEQVHIDLERTGEIFKAVSKYGVCIAQHGITGTPLNLVGEFADYGIRKGNVGTLWQNVAHKGLPPELMETMRSWAKEAGKDIKFATRQFKADLDSLPKEYKDKIADLAYKEATDFITAFRGKGSASLIAEKLS